MANAMSSASISRAPSASWSASPSTTAASIATASSHVPQRRANWPPTLRPGHGLTHQGRRISIGEVHGASGSGCSASARPSSSSTCGRTPASGGSTSARRRYCAAVSGAPCAIAEAAVRRASTTHASRSGSFRLSVLRRVRQGRRRCASGCAARAWTPDVTRAPIAIDGGAHDRMGEGQFRRRREDHSRTSASAVLAAPRSSPASAAASAIGAPSPRTATARANAMPSLGQRYGTAGQGDVARPDLRTAQPPAGPGGYPAPSSRNSSLR